MSGSVDEKITVLVAGDFAPVNEIEKLCMESNEKSGQLVFGKALPVLLDKDISIVNLECPLTTQSSPIGKCGPCIKVDPSCIELLGSAGFDAVALANNHIFDHGADGLTATLELCKKHEIKTVGVGDNLKEASKPLSINIKGKTVTFVNLAENEFSIASHDSPGANPLDPIHNYSQIIEAKNTSDYVIVILHGGNEYYPLPSTRMRDTCRFFADLGVSSVITHHTHVASGYEVYKGVPIFYGLGNFIFPSLKRDGATEAWHQGYFVKLYFEPNEQVGFNIFPYSQCDEGTEFKLLEGNEKTDFLTMIEDYSHTIEDDQALRKEWDRFCEANRIDYMSYFLMLNIFERQLFKRNIFPEKIAPKVKLRYILNVIRCEAHRDAILAAIEKTLSSSAP